MVTDNTHVERNIVEALRRISDIERRISKTGSTSIAGSRIVGGASTPSTGDVIKDHRLLENLNSTLYWHLTLEEYQAMSTLNQNHGVLTGLLDDDHPQYILHSLADNENDMLVASSDDTFVKKSLEEIRQLISPKLYPQSDSISAISMLRADGETAIVTVDTVNQIVTIDKYLHIAEDLQIEDGDIIFENSATIKSDDGHIAMSPNTYLSLDGGSHNTIFIEYDTAVQSTRFASEVYGWRIEHDGTANFGNLSVNELSAKALTAEVEQALAGSQIISKSSAMLSQNFTVPVPGATSDLVVKSFTGYSAFRVFADGDYIRLRYMTREGQAFNIADCWGTVVWASTDESSLSQTYTFTRSAIPNSGTANAGQIIETGALALDYGVSGSGFIETTAV